MEKLNKIFCTTQVPAIDKYTIEHEPVSSLQLMERAANIWVEYFQKVFRESRKVTVIAGNGNNGGDGYAIARLLKSLQVDVVVFRLMTGGKLSSDCEENYKRWLEVGGIVIEVNKVEDLKLQEQAIIIDAIFGSGLNRKVTGLAAEVIRRINAGHHTVAAVDIPSGLMGEDNSTNSPDTIICADYTFTFQFPKIAFLLPENARYVGKWQVLDIGLSRTIMEIMPTPYFYTDMDQVKKLLPLPEKFAHKGNNGKGLLIAGSCGMMGAVILAAKAALRSGVGVLHCHIPAKGIDIIQTAVPEAITEGDRSEVRFSGVVTPALYDAIAVGPALGQGPETVTGLKKLLQDWRGITILDADALNILAGHTELLELLHEKCILTPHVKEFERLVGKSKNDFDRLNKLSNFANRFRIYIILKGAHSVVATPDGRFYFNMSGNPGMAKGGAGDTLTGVLLALAANGLKMEDIARIGVFAHGLSGDLLVEEYGFRGITAGMIAEGMGKAWKELEKPE